MKRVSLTIKQAEHALFIANAALEQHVKIMQEGSVGELENEETNNNVSDLREKAQDNSRQLRLRRTSTVQEEMTDR
jgi:hypothetical protein